MKKNIENKNIIDVLENMKKLKISKKYLLSNLDCFDLKYQNRHGINGLMYILLYNEERNLGFKKKDILNILDKFDLKQKTKNK